MTEFEQIKSASEPAKNQFYTNIVQHLQQLEIPVHLKTLIQVDTYRPTNGRTINKKVADDILYGASLLQLLSPENPGRSSFSDFKSSFMNRYEMQWMPLVEVLDTEAGIGYGKFATSGMEESPLIDNLPLDTGRSNGNNAMPDAEAFKWELYQQAILENKTETTIKDKTIEELSKKETTSTGLPDSVYSMVRINAASAAEIDNGNYTISMTAPGGPSGGNLLGRFCHLDAEIEKMTRTVLQNEEAHLPDCIFAEIVHLPESRIGNILMRPVMRNYEIPYLCGSTLETEFQIPVTDLLVGVENGQVVLRSKRLNKRIMPRLTSAHNFSMTTLPMYQFLCDLQYQDIKGVGWTWGNLESRPFLPRVSYGKYILSKATWVLTKEDVQACYKKSDDELLKVFSEIVKKKNLPRYILLSQGDNELLLDLTNIFCIKLLLPEVNKYLAVKLVETFDYPEQCWIESPEGHHAGEFLFTFNKNVSAHVKSASLLAPEEPYTIQRYYPVGSEWLYAKIYCGSKTGEKILADVIKPFTAELLEEGLIDKYFFLRYYDPAAHIRIRFHNAANKDFWKEVISRLQAILQPYMNNHSVYNLQFETYQREVERYGFDTMESSEDIFHHHSTAIVNFISMLEGDEGEQYRWQVALRAIDIFLDDFGYSLLSKKDLIKWLHQSFSREFNISTPQRRKLSERFSTNKKIVQMVMSDEWSTDENLKHAITVFINQDEGYKNAISNVLSASSVKNNPQQVNNLMSSYLHMFINRMFVGNQRKVELVIYDYLLKYYESKIAREAGQKVQAASGE
jgi:thiopeptide-type bacteriocin biosynthesis protein